MFFNTRWLSWLIAGLTIGLMGIGLALQVITGAPFLGGPFFIHFSEAAGLSGFAIIGALIVSRHPRHPIGWIWLLISLAFGVDHLAWGYAYYGYIAHPGSLPGAGVMVVWLYWLGRGAVGMLGITLLLLLFPTGRPLSRRWSVVAWLAVGRTALSFPVSALAPDPLGYFPFPTDLIAASDAAFAILVPLKTALNFVGVFCVVAAAFSLVLRFKQSRGVERQQIKWFVFSIAFLPLAFILIALGGNLQSSGYSFPMLAGATLGVFSTVVMSAASAIAIFRYRLYDIDIIIRRTITYSLVTATLAILYSACVVLLSQLFSILSGQSNSPLVLVIATLSITASSGFFFRRIQDGVDRRFYRRKYNAEKIVQAFGAVLRHEVEIEQLSQNLLMVIEETVQPVNVSLWMKREASRTGATGQPQSNDRIGLEDSQA